MCWRLQFLSSGNGNPLYGRRSHGVASSIAKKESSVCFPVLDDNLVVIWGKNFRADNLYSWRKMCFQSGYLFEKIGQFLRLSYRFIDLESGSFKISMTLALISMVSHFVRKPDKNTLKSTVFQWQSSKLVCNEGIPEGINWMSSHYGIIN